MPFVASVLWRDSCWGAKHWLTSRSYNTTVCMSKIVSLLAALASMPGSTALLPHTFCSLPQQVTCHVAVGNCHGQQQVFLEGLPTVSQFSSSLPPNSNTIAFWLICTSTCSPAAGSALAASTAAAHGAAVKQERQRIVCSSATLCACCTYLCQMSQRAWQQHNWQVESLLACCTLPSWYKAFSFTKSSSSRLPASTSEL